MNQSNNFELAVFVHGSSARTYKHEGRVYIEGREGSEFTVSIKNNTPQKVLAVLTVDGLSVMNGKEAGFESGGYILEAWGSVKVPGWRLNNKEVASFEFTKPWDSYAAGKGKGGNLGVIGCAFYYEKYVPYTFTYTTGGTQIFTSGTPDFGTGITNLYCASSHSTMSQNADATGSSTATIKSFNMNSALQNNQEKALVRAQLGTGFGDKAKHRVNEESFQRATSTPAEILTVYYDSKQGLQARGIDTEWAPSVAPSPFPKENVDKYCQPPTGWTR